jgi:hypothetical protein
MDGLKWANGAKSDTRGTKSLLGAEFVSPGSLVLLAEGAPDLLACYIYKFYGRKLDMRFASDAIPVAMLGAGARIKDEDLAKLMGARVLIVPHLDSAGIKARDIWKDQLREAGIPADGISLERFVFQGGKDLSDTLDPYPKEELLWRIECKADQLRK